MSKSNIKVANSSDTAPAIKWPRTTKETDAFFQSGEGAQWFSELPDNLKKVWSWELYHGSYAVFARNTNSAQLIETRADELAAVLAQLEAQGLTLAALVAFDRVSRGLEPFNEHGDHRLPKGYRSSDPQREEGA